MTWMKTQDLGAFPPMGTVPPMVPRSSGPGGGNGVKAPVPSNLTLRGYRVPGGKMPWQTPGSPGPGNAQGSNQWWRTVLQGLYPNAAISGGIASPDALARAQATPQPISSQPAPAGTMSPGTINPAILQMLLGQSNARRPAASTVGQPTYGASNWY